MRIYRGHSKGGRGARNNDGRAIVLLFQMQLMCQIRHGAGGPIRPSLGPKLKILLLIVAESSNVPQLDFGILDYAFYHF